MVGTSVETIISRQYLYPFLGNYTISARKSQALFYILAGLGFQGHFRFSWRFSQIWDLSDWVGRGAIVDFQGGFVIFQVGFCVCGVVFVVWGMTGARAGYRTGDYPPPGPKRYPG